MSVLRYLSYDSFKNYKKGDFLTKKTKYHCYIKKKMNQIDINKRFVKALENKIPKKTDLANFVSETLFIEKETAYRRLRSEVQFSLREAIMIASKLNISIEEIMIKENLKEIGRNSMQMPLIKINAEQYHSYIQSTFSFLKKLNSDPYSEYGLALTQITFSIFYNYSYILRFYMLKHIYNTEDTDKRKTFDEIKETAELSNARKELYFYYRQISYTYYIWDVRIIPALINDILYFKKIYLITDTDVKKLKEELYLLLNEFEQLTTDGYYKETGNKFDLYISETTIDHTYACLHSERYWVSMSTSFISNEIVSHDKTTFNNVRNWIQSLTRSSILISGSAEKEKIKFFQTQRQLLDLL